MRCIIEHIMCGNRFLNDSRITMSELGKQSGMSKIREQKSDDLRKFSMKFVV